MFKMMIKYKRGKYPFSIAGLLIACGFLSACKDDRFDGLQNDSQLLRSNLEMQQQTVESLLARLTTVEGAISIASPSFSIEDVQLTVEERMFDPLINGSFLVSVSGVNLPDAIFLELEITTSAKGTKHSYSQNVIHRIMTDSKHENRIEFTHPLKMHKVKKSEVAVNVTPMIWYQGHLVQHPTDQSDTSK